YDIVSHWPMRIPFDDPKVRTVFVNPEYLLMAMNPDDSRIREGTRVVQTIVHSLHQQLEARGVRFIVALIPSKHLVYEPRVRRNDSTISPSYFEAVSRELRLRANLTD